MNDRTCIVTRNSGDRDRLIRFVAGPDGNVVPDLKQSLPGRGCWVTGTRGNVDTAVRKNLFARALRSGIKPDRDLGSLVDSLLMKSALGSIGLARKAGMLLLGAAKVEATVRRGSAIAVLHASQASPDGVRKISQARRAVALAGGPHIGVYDLFSEEELSLALGGTNVIHAALLAGSAGDAAVQRLEALRQYRDNPGRNDQDVTVSQGGTAS